MVEKNKNSHWIKRLQQLPVDWTLMVDERPIQWLLQGIRSRFEIFGERGGGKGVENML